MKVWQLAVGTQPWGLGCRRGSEMLRPRVAMLDGFHLLLQICSPSFYTMLYAPRSPPTWAESKAHLPLACHWLLPMGSTSKKSEDGRRVGWERLSPAPSLWDWGWPFPLVPITTPSFSPSDLAPGASLFLVFSLCLPHTLANGACIECLTLPSWSVLCFLIDPWLVRPDPRGAGLQAGMNA